MTSYLSEELTDKIIEMHKKLAEAKELYDSLPTCVKIANGPELGFHIHNAELEARKFEQKMHIADWGLPE